MPQGPQAANALGRYGGSTMSSAPPQQRLVAPMAGRYPTATAAGRSILDLLNVVELPWEFILRENIDAFRNSLSFFVVPRRHIR